MLILRIFSVVVWCHRMLSYDSGILVHFFTVFLVLGKKSRKLIISLVYRSPLWNAAIHEKLLIE